ncbi:MAG: uridine monophosphate synthetase [Cellvibrionaceae bacterium]|jgi:uridine monophosphate synthetase
MENKLQDLAIALYETGAVRFGNFTLHSGKKSPIYIDLRIVVTYPELLKKIAKAYATVLNEKEFDVLSAYPYAGLPLGVATSLEMSRPLIYPRKEMKTYGTGKSIEGIFEVGQKTILIEDLITSGKSISEAFAILRAAGLSGNESIVLIDRQQGGIQQLQAEGIEVTAIITLTRLLEMLVEAQKIDDDQREKIISQLGIVS